MITSVFENQHEAFIVQSKQVINDVDMPKLSWLLRASIVPTGTLAGCFVGPRKEVVSPWSTNATEITNNMGIAGICRIEQFRKEQSAPQLLNEKPLHDPMLEAVYNVLDAKTLLVEQKPAPVKAIDDISAFNKEAGLALSEQEVSYLENVSKKLGRLFTDSELFGFAQINSEHCRHKVFNGTFVIDGKQKSQSLFALIKSTSAKSPQNIVSAYKDNVAFTHGPTIRRFAPKKCEDGMRFGMSTVNAVLSLKAETHNFPTTVEPFNGASTGSGGEIRDRMAGGKGSIPLAGTAVYMTSYPRDSRKLQNDVRQKDEIWQTNIAPRKWKYQSPEQILVKASNGASDFGNKFGQPLITGSLLVFEGKVKMDGSDMLYGYDRAVMLAGGVGYANELHAKKDKAQVGDVLVVLGGDNYRIGMAGGSVSSVDTGKYGEAIELSAIQRANPEMQKRVYNAIRTLVEEDETPIRIIHDHGAGGHINCISELFEETGGVVKLSALPVGDPTLSVTELICNESQERMGLVIAKDDVSKVSLVADRERAPMYVVGEITGNKRIIFEEDNGNTPVDLTVECLFGSSPDTEIKDNTVSADGGDVHIDLSSGDELLSLLSDVLSLESVGCKDWLTNKVDRSVTGLVAQQQCVGPLQVPLSNCGVMSLDYVGTAGIATAIGHAPMVGLISPESGAELSVAESLTNIVWAPLKDGLNSVVLSANWMWPCKQSGESARLYAAVEALSLFCIELGIAVPTGKDSLSMTMNYEDMSVRAPGTVVVSSMGECSDIRGVCSPYLRSENDSLLLYVDWSGDNACPLGGSSVAQVLNVVGNDAPRIKDRNAFKQAFGVTQELVKEKRLLAGHDVSAGGVLCAVCEMAFAGRVGVSIDVREISQAVEAWLFCEKPGVVLQVYRVDVEKVKARFIEVGCAVCEIGTVETNSVDVSISTNKYCVTTSLEKLFKTWMLPSHILDCAQTRPNEAKERFKSSFNNPLSYRFPDRFLGTADSIGASLDRTKNSGISAAIVREKGVNGDREMAFALYAAGFDVKDITMSDLMCGRETLEDVSCLVFPGGFANSDVLGAARGWAGAFHYNVNAKNALQRFLERKETLSFGVCNGCQLMVELGIFNDKLADGNERVVTLNQNKSGKFESIFLSVEVSPSPSIMLAPLVGCQLGAWISHGEGQFIFDGNKSDWNIPMRFSYDDYPANPNGSMYSAAGVVSSDGRHLAIMPHIERSFLPWQWGYYSPSRKGDEVTPWLMAFTAAFNYTLR